MQEQEVGFIELLRVNSTFRKYWVGNSISMLGEWFNTVALFVLIDQLTGSELALGLLFVLRMFSLALPQIFTGMLADRFSRKWLMVGANFASALTVAGFLLIDSKADVWLVYFLSALLMLFHAIYLPAENATMPNITKPNELLTANALNSATWSASLAIGSAVGGAVVASQGVQIAFIINSIAFIVAGLIIASINIPQQKIKAPEGNFIASSLSQVKEGFQIIIGTPKIYRIITAKAAWGLFGGGLVYMLILVGADIGLGEVAAGIGLLFAARGVGTGLGPILARYAFTNRENWSLLIGRLVSVCGIGYIAMGWLSWGWWVALFVVFSHAASGANWVISTVLLQERSEDEWRGRMFSTDFLLLTMVNGISTLAASLILEYTDIGLRELVQIFAVGQLLSGILWVMLIAPGEKKYLAMKREENTAHN
ncbi:MAG TPA: MFS transporter [Candidatus Poseidoniales archaeon]|nr:MAG: MFS transporter [Euryarchaeota archaeon]PXY78710.1 MAG: MFS transporter [Euryarchaeota archaeon]HIB24052.1 MFS transporter [Candidatus Poseidoniales archaeon]HIN44937.1 MFS transporter [Candidatus Poseidoniales archaeon]HIO86791.1 MFS transporter [Candidatus Poseidoniales archaeon]